MSFVCRLVSSSLSIIHCFSIDPCFHRCFSVRLKYFYGIFLHSILYFPSKRSKQCSFFVSLSLSLFFFIYSIVTTFEKHKHKNFRFSRCSFSIHLDFNAVINKDFVSSLILLLFDYLEGKNH